jgi:hypothetical protein
MVLLSAGSRGLTVAVVYAHTVRVTINEVSSGTTADYSALCLQ